MRLAIIILVTIFYLPVLAQEKRKAIICLTYDDGLESHLSTVIPQLDSANLKGTFKKINTMQVPSWFVEEGTTLNELIEFAEKAKKAHGMAIYQFHGIGEQFLKISKEAHKAFLDYLSKNQADYQVATFSEAMELVIK